VTIRDWAFKKAVHLRKYDCGEEDCDTHKNEHEDIANALRMAKSEGLKQAAEYVTNLGLESKLTTDERTLLWNAGEALRRMADKP
jgi:hypothetical protein